MNNIMKINNQEVVIKEFEGQRVVTFKDIDLVHNRPDGTAKRNFNNNKNYLIKNEDYFEITRKEFSTNFVPNSKIEGNPNLSIILLTENGYLLLIKSFTDELSWQVQRQLVKSYFKIQSKPKTQLELLQLEFEAIKEVNEKVEAINSDLQNFKQELPLLGVDCARIINAKNKKVVPMLGGKNSQAYKNNSLRNQVYSDIGKEIHRQFGVSNYKEIKRSQIEDVLKVIDNYNMPIHLQEKIKNINLQLSFTII